MSAFPVFDREAVEVRLDYRGCIAAVRAAMLQFSRQGTDQPLRQIVETAPARLFALMPGTLGSGEAFGAKIVTAFGDPMRPGRSTHRGVVVLFDAESGAVAAIGDAGAITDIRTACASAVATDALARADATKLGIFGCGTLAATHLRALPLVRRIDTVRVWGRDPSRAAAFAQRAAAETGLRVRAVEDPREAAECDIVTTLTGAHTPVLYGEWLRPGAHVNLVGSSVAGPVEVDDAVVRQSRYIADSRRSVLAAGAEFLAAKARGLVDDQHIAGEIGEVLAGVVEGRNAPDQITVYKSLGHIVQDLAALRYIAGRN